MSRSMKNNKHVELPDDYNDALMDFFKSCPNIVPKYDDCLPKPTPEPTEFVFTPQPTPIPTPTPTPNPIGPNNYDRVRFVGTFTSTDSTYCVLRRPSGDIIESVVNFTSDWYYPQPDKPGNSEEPYLTLNGAYFTFCTTPVYSQRVILDDRWDALNNESRIISGTSWVNYPTFSSGCNEIDGYVGNPDLLGVKWRTTATLRCNGFEHSYGQSIGFGGIAANKMSKGVDSVSGAAPSFNNGSSLANGTDFDFYALLIGSQPVSNPVEGTITGVWQFEKDGVTVELSENEML